MNSNEIITYAKLFGIKDFIGVFAVDQLSLIPKSKTGLIIFNTDTSESIGQHWIALRITQNYIFYAHNYPSPFGRSEANQLNGFNLNVLNNQYL